MNSLASNKVTRIKQIISNIADDFNLDKLSKSPARFNLKKLEWFNAEYIKRLPLLEFSYRADKLKFSYRADKQPDEFRTRIGDYVYLVDSSKGLVFGEKWEHIWPDGDGYFYPLGGGREILDYDAETNYVKYEDSKNCAVREVLEESNNQIHINPDKLIPIIQRVFKFEKPTLIEGKLWDAKEFNYYFYEIDSEGINNCFGDNDANCCWQSISEVLSQNKFITYSIWYNFCQENQLPLPKPNIADIKKLLAYKLDQTRIIKLSDIGAESSVIYNYKPCSLEDIKWKKDTLEGSQKKLKEISDNFVSGINSDLLWQEFDKKYNLKELSQDNYLEEASNWWSEKVKDYLTKNNLDFGEYLWPLRLALSGNTKSPSAFEIMVIIGREETVERIKKYL